MSSIVDQLFPPIKTDEDENIEYTSFNYWRNPVDEFELELEQLPKDPKLTQSNSSSSLQSVQSKPLATIPEN